jgi:polysaccharide pyruvyl transferase WcaK-like protein
VISRRELEDAVDPDRALLAVLSGLIEATAIRRALSPGGGAWRAGEPLRLFLAGYVGCRNTGADVRVAELVRQLRWIFGDGALELTLPTSDAALSEGYFPGARQIPLPALFPALLARECPRHHGVVACEGSMFKSKFGNGLTAYTSGALGFANAEHKLSVGYGGEAGAMDPAVERFVAAQCRHSLVLCRNEASREVLGRLGIRTTLGTDTAWTFEPAPRAHGLEELRALGWDGRSDVLAVCPVDPFCWPVKPDLVRAATLLATGRGREEQYRAFYFHHASPEARARLSRYLDALARAVQAFRRDSGAFVVVVGMEKLDRRPCEELAARLDPAPPVVVSDRYRMHELVALLRACTLLLSSRYHAIVTTMPARVPSGGVTMDERIVNLMADRGHPHLVVGVDDPDLEERALGVLRALSAERERVADELARAVPRHLELMGRMGMDFVAEVVRHHPEAARRSLPPTWEAHLPPLSPDLLRLLEGRPAPP